MSARLTSAMQVALVMRRVQAEGGFATVLAKGDETAGSILLVALEKGRTTGLYEHLLQQGSIYKWLRVGPQDIENTEEFDQYLVRRRSRDPDLWVIELDIANAERFAAQLDE